MKSSRRNFLQTAGIAAAAAVIPPGTAFAQSEVHGKLPEPIAKLKSRKAEAKPITTPEREQRI